MNILKHTYSNHKQALQDLEQEQRLNLLNTKALDYIADKYPGLVNEAFANIDREEEQQ